MHCALDFITADCGFRDSPEYRDLVDGISQFHKLPNGQYRRLTRPVLWPQIVGDGLALIHDLRPQEVTVPALRTVLFHDLLDYRPFRLHEVREMLPELVAWFRFVARRYDSESARDCMKWLMQPGTRAALERRGQ